MTGTGDATSVTGVIIDDGGQLVYTAREHAKLSNLTHASVFLRRDAELAEAFAVQTVRACRRHLQDCINTLANEYAGVTDSLVLPDGPVDLRAVEPHGVCLEGCRPKCLRCGRHKKPVGRVAPIGLHNMLCREQCKGYQEEPTPCDLWPDETRDW